MFHFEDICAALDRISGVIHKTPVMTSSYIDSLCDMKVYFKCEQLQKTGSFKARGALNAVFPVIVYIYQLTIFLLTFCFGKADR